MINGKSTPIQSNSGNPATLLDRVSAEDAKRIGEIRSRISDLYTAKDLDVHPTQVGCFVWEILRMPLLDKAIAERLDVQYHRIFQMVNIVETVMSVLNARDDRELAARDDRDGNPEDGELTALFGSLSAVRETLENIAEHLEPIVILKRQDIAGACTG
jgi:hypothetical protein